MPVSPVFYELPPGQQIEVEAVTGGRFAPHLGSRSAGGGCIAGSNTNGQLLTHSNHLGTHLDGEIHFFTAGKDIAQLELSDFLIGPGVVVDLSDAAGDYQIYTAEMIEVRVEVREGDILIIHTGYHHFGWDMPYADEIRYMVQHPGPDREFAVWAKEKKIKWIGVDCGSADHPMPAPGCKHR
jgi:arylformamidase